MSFGQRCACAVCFMLGIIISSISNHLFFTPSIHKNATCDVIKSLSSFKETLNELILATRQNSPEGTFLIKAKLENSAAQPSHISKWTAVSSQESATSSTNLADFNTSTSRTIKSMKKLRLLCWILTGPKNHQKRAKNVKETWGKRCDKLLFISSEEDSSLPTTVIKGSKEGRTGLWSKTRGAFKLIHDKYLNEADFFLKADDDTFVIVENLKYLLKDYNSSVPYYFGCLFQTRDKKKNTIRRWHSGGAGYVLSRAAVKAVVEKGYRHSTCKRGVEGGAEDLNLSYCLIAANVTYVDTRDEFGRYRFNGYPAKTHVPGATPKWWGQYIKYPQKPGFDCCSKHAISFHYISPNEMLMYEYLIYHLRPYGIS